VYTVQPSWLLTHISSLNRVSDLCQQPALKTTLDVGCRYIRLNYHFFLSGIVAVRGVYSQSVYIELGDYQTLLRPMKKVVEEEDDAADNDACDDVDNSTSTSLYGDDTLRAIAVITDKYDSFRRRQMRVRSFLAARVSRSASRDSTSASDDVIGDSCRRDASTTSTRSDCLISLSLSLSLSTSSNNNKSMR